MTIRLDNAVLRAACEEQFGETPADGKLHLFGIRGAFQFDFFYRPLLVEFHGNAHNLYNDTLGHFGTHLAAFPGTTDPGSVHTKKPMHPDGAAYLLPGHYLYKRGKHRGKWALVQAGPVSVRRDRDRDGRPENNEPISTGQWLGLNIHRMGTGVHVMDWSAGCQGVNGQYWDEFYAPVVAVDPCCELIFDYWLLDKRGFE